jgi:acyl dehydratase
MPALMAAIKDPEVIGDPKRFLRLLHGEHDLRFHGKLVPGRVYETTVKIAKVAEKAGNEIIELKIMTVDKGKGDVVIETGSTMFIHGEHKNVDGAAPPPERAARPEPARTLVLDASEQVAADQSLRYADASGDHNPIHKDPEVAKKAGLPDIILHGLCSMAFCQKAVINNLAGGEPERLKRLKVRFAKPVLNGQALAIHGWESDAAPWSRVVAFDARVDGHVVLKDGIAEIAV